MHEIRAYLSYSGLRYPIFFWNRHEGVEVDLVCETRKGYLAIEIKSSTRWDGRFNRGLKTIAEELGKTKTKLVGIYDGERAAQTEGIEILPLKTFLQRLWDGQIIQ